jgi:hypothetical protein
MTQLVQFPVTKIKGSSPKLQATQYENNQRKNKTAFHRIYRKQFQDVYSASKQQDLFRRIMQSQLIAMMRGSNTSMQGQLAETGTCR